MNKTTALIVCISMLVVGIAGWTWMSIIGKPTGPFPILTGFGIGLTSSIGANNGKENNH